MITVKQAEKFAFQTFSVDGLIDFWAGVTVLLIGLGWTNEDLILFANFSALITIPLWKLSRKYLSEPRLGLVNLSTVRRAKLSHTLLASVLAGSAVLGAVAFLAFDPDKIGRDLLQDIVPMVPNFILAAMFLIGGFILTTWRFVAYAAWIAGMGYVGIAEFDHPAASLILGSLFPILGGLYIFSSFYVLNPRNEG